MHRAVISNRLRMPNRDCIGIVERIDKQAATTRQVPARERAGGGERRKSYQPNEDY